MLDAAMSGSREEDLRDRDSKASEVSDDPRAKPLVLSTHQQHAAAANNAIVRWIIRISLREECFAYQCIFL